MNFFQSGRKTMRRHFRLALAVLSLIPLGAAEYKKVEDVEFARVDERSLKLDLYLPASGPKQPLIVYIHGGAWRAGTKSEMPLINLVEDGWPAASVEYRLSTEAKFPAQV